MSKLNRYKKLENSLARRLGGALFAFFSGIKAFFGRLIKLGKQRLTIMFVPHSEKRIINVQISIFTLVGFAAVAVIAFGAFTFFTARYADTARVLAGKSQDLRDTRSDLDSIRDETTNLVKAARNFETVLSQTLSRIGIHRADASSGGATGDLATFYDMEETATGSVREAGEIRNVTRYLERTTEPLKELGSLVASQSGVLSEIPNLWPIQGGIGHISMYYGQNENPFYGSWYLHKGLDISTFRSGDSIVATADGKVASVGYDSGYGNNVIIEHKHGFITRYCHLSSYRVQKGDKIQQGEVIGYIGSTGISTGPHLHYEVHLGTETIDPLRFLNIRSSVALNVGTR
ncbi:MAG: M23 family metallopeptidase [Spirochaetes bacterium]|nr:M23 family metallopeptidase [Spirochaetota bacterium]